MYRTAAMFTFALLAAAPLGAQSSRRSHEMYRSRASYERLRDHDGRVTRRFIDSRGRLCTERVHEKRNGDRKYSLDCKVRKGKHANRHDRYDRDGRYDRDDRNSRYPSRYPTTGSRYPTRGDQRLGDIVSVILGQSIQEPR